MLPAPKLQRLECGKNLASSCLSKSALLQNEILVEISENYCKSLVMVENEKLLQSTKELTYFSSKLIEQVFTKGPWGI